MLYWKEHGSKAINKGQVASSLRQFISFLDQDKVTIAVTVEQLTIDVFRRFIRWRTNPHSYEILWQGKEYTHASDGVSGESISRNLDDVRAALNHQVNEGRLIFVPKIPGVPTDMRSPARDVTLTYEQMGAILGYAWDDPEPRAWILGMLATAARPDAVLKWNIKEQWKGGPLFNTHPHKAPRTKKRNAVVPVIPPFVRWLKEWQVRPRETAVSRKTWWRTMREQLDLPVEIVPKTIRHTVATELRAKGVPQLDVEGLLGHLMSNRTTAVYAKYDPARLSLAKQGLEEIWRDVWREARKWRASHLRTTQARGRPLSVTLKEEKTNVSIGL